MHQKMERNHEGEQNRDAERDGFSAEERRKFAKGLRERSILCGCIAAVCGAVGVLMLVLKFTTESQTRFHAVALLFFVLAALFAADAFFVRRKALQMQREGTAESAFAHSREKEREEGADEDEEMLRRLEREEVENSALSPVGLPFGIAYVLLTVLLFLFSFLEWDPSGTARSVLLLFLYAALGAHAFLVSEYFFERLRSVAVFAAELLLLFWFVLFNNRYWLFVCLLVQVALMVYTLAVWLVARVHERKVRSNFIVFVGIGLMMFFLLCGVLEIQPENEIFMAWLIIPAVVIALIVAVFIFLPFRDFFRAALKQTGELVAMVFIVLFGAYIALWAGAVTGNAAFSPPPVVGTYTVLDKNFSDGQYLQSHTLTVAADGKEVDVEVAEEVYDATEIGDAVQVGYFAGGFSLPFYLYFGEGDEAE